MAGATEMTKMAKVVVGPLEGARLLELLRVAMLRPTAEAPQTLPPLPQTMRARGRWLVMAAARRAATTVMTPEVVTRRRGHACLTSCALTVALYRRCRVVLRRLACALTAEASRCARGWERHHLPGRR